MTPDQDRYLHQLRSAYPIGSSSVGDLSASYVHVVLVQQLTSAFKPKKAGSGWYSSLAARVKNPVGYGLENDAEHAELKTSLLAVIRGLEVPPERLPAVVGQLDRLIVREALAVIEPHPDD
jgi:hypothetical protein